MNENTVTSPIRQLKYLPMIRLVVLAALLASIYLAASSNGLLEQFSPENIRDLVAQWGWLSVCVYIVIFSLGQLLYIPGVVFVVAAALAFDNTLGFVCAMLGVAAAISVSFFVVRLVGGTPLANIKHRWVANAMASLDTRPLTSIFVLRVVFSTAPYINYLLALSKVRYRHYLLASFVGIIPQVALTILFADWFLQFV